MQHSSQMLTGHDFLVDMEVEAYSDGPSLCSYTMSFLVGHKRPRSFTPTLAEDLKDRQAARF